MHLRIRDMAAKPEWLAKIDGLLHDAEFRQRFSYDQAAGAFSLNLDRIGYEYGVRKLGFLLWRFPRVPCALVLAPVQIVSIEEREDAWDWFDELVDISLVGPSHIQFTTRGAKVVLCSREPITLTLTDTGAPDETSMVTDFFASIVPMKIVAEIVGTSDA